MVSILKGYHLLCEIIRNIGKIPFSFTDGPVLSASLNSSLR